MQELLGDFDPGTPPPPIEAPQDRGPRPLWSVMIPTFNCAHLLRKTLESVLAQDPGSDLMHIEVVDDCSTKDDPQSVVQELGRGRVAFTRNAQNTGCCTLNFNICLQRSIGRYVHVLHGDDWVLPGFYERAQEAWKAAPDLDGVITRTFIVNESGEIETLGERLPLLEGNSPADAERFLRETLFYENPIRTPSVVVRRAFYERHGGFLPSLVHVADWEMCTRLLDRGRVIFINEALAAYRFFESSDTGRLVRTGGNVLDYVRLGLILKQRHQSFDSDRFVNLLYDTLRVQAKWFKKRGDSEAEACNRRIIKSLACLHPRPKQGLARVRRQAKSLLGRFAEGL